MDKSKKNPPAASLWGWRFKIALFWLIWIGLDQATKFLAMEYLPEISQASYPYGGLALGDFFGIQSCLVLAYNRGAAWNLLDQATGLLWGLRSAFIAALAFYLLHRVKPKYSWPLSFMVAGALSNWIDQTFRGFVVDMLSVTFWGYSYPIFNVADSMICLSALALALSTFRKSSR